MDEARQNSAVFRGSKEQFAHSWWNTHLIHFWYKNGNNYRASVIVSSIDCVFSRRLSLIQDTLLSTLKKKIIEIETERQNCQEWRKWRFRKGIYHGFV